MSFPENQSEHGDNESEHAKPPSILPGTLRNTGVLAKRVTPGKITVGEELLSAPDG